MNKDEETKLHEFITTWIDKKYSGAKDLGDWATHEVVEIMYEYASEERKEALNNFANYIDEHYQEGDDTFSIHDWLEQFNQKEGEYWNDK